MLTDLYASFECHVIAIDNGMLDHAHGIGPGWQRGPGGDRHGLARSERRGGRVPGGDPADQAQGAWYLSDIGGTNGIAVHCRIGEGRDVLGSDHLGGEHGA
jgi:hypothetical protein